MSANYDVIVGMLASNMLEVYFQRRDGSGSRRMLCTNSPRLLDGIAGKTAFHYKQPKRVGLPYSPRDKNLVVVYDLLQQRYRQIPLESMEVMWMYPLRTAEDMSAFWQYFRDYLKGLSSQEKTAMMLR